jgi:hypothetical protein
MTDIKICRDRIREFVTEKNIRGLESLAVMLLETVETHQNDEVKIAELNHASGAMNAAVERVNSMAERANRRGGW